MSYGMQTYNSTGGLVVDISDRLTRQVGLFTITLTGTGNFLNKNVTVSGMVDDGTWAVIYPVQSYVNYVKIGTGFFTVNYTPTAYTLFNKVTFNVLRV